MLRYDPFNKCRMLRCDPFDFVPFVIASEAWQSHNFYDFQLIYNFFTMSASCSLLGLSQMTRPSIP